MRHTKPVANVPAHRGFALGLIPAAPKRPQLGRAYLSVGRAPAVSHPNTAPTNRAAVAIRQRKHIRLDRTQIKYLALIVAAVLLFICLYVGALYAATPARGNATEPTTAPVRPVRPCKTVTPQTFNRRVKLLDKLTGKRHHKASRKVCKSHYRKLGAKVRKARADCKRKARQTEASVYWPGADSGGMIGSCGHYLGNYKYGFAELGMGTYMGHLPCGTVVYVHGPNGRTVATPKVDIGFGSGSSGRAIDLWHRTGPAVGIGNGIGQVTYSLKNCWIK